MLTSRRRCPLEIKTLKIGYKFHRQHTTPCLVPRRLFLFLKDKSAQRTKVGGKGAIFLSPMVLRASSSLPVARATRSPYFALSWPIEASEEEADTTLRSNSVCTLHYKIMVLKSTPTVRMAVCFLHNTTRVISQ